MILLIDAGNSRMKATTFSESVLGDVFSVPYDDKQPLDCLVSYLEAKSPVDSLVLVSVLGTKFEQAIKEYCTDKKIRLVWASSSQVAHGVKNNYDDPTALGSDRFVALVGAVKQFPKQYCIVVDCGTAVTIDGLTIEGEFKGGVILPGLQLWGQSLIGRTSQLKENNLKSPPLFAKNTADAIGGGSVYGLVGAVDSVCTKMKQHFIESGAKETSIKLVICGGDAALVASHSQLEFTLSPHLVLTGLVHYI
ncbi:type III pantothenate kinase [Leucothrix arctica]|uniref:Type III pantothenate kinase n=1 Tax=Leucothrix arctica TaxID=1481894 RepID=A0A317CAC1_9GAMM|nr:type III pantothenate kinase [Leucothrix arctica]PWQ94283.1 hypothetical protein DKT75_16105 [Leucothrix arctica]